MCVKVILRGVHFHNNAFSPFLVIGLYRASVAVQRWKYLWGGW